MSKYLRNNKRKSKLSKNQLNIKETRNLIRKLNNNGIINSQIHPWYQEQVEPKNKIISDLSVYIGKQITAETKQNIANCIHDIELDLNRQNDGFNYQIDDLIFNGDTFEVKIRINTPIIYNLIQTMKVKYESRVKK